MLLYVIAHHQRLLVPAMLLMPRLVLCPQRSSVPRYLAREQQVFKDYSNERLEEEWSHRQEGMSLTWQDRETKTAPHGTLL